MIPYVANCSLNLILRVSFSIKGYHSYYGVFSSADFCSHCSDLGQSLHFNGVGAQHLNGVAELAIQTVTNMAHTNMLHSTFHWHERSFIDLWQLAMTYAVWGLNNFQWNGVGLSPEELFYGVKCPCSGLPYAQVFG